jgi:beta-lactamase class A
VNARRTALVLGAALVLPGARPAAAATDAALTRELEAAVAGFHGTAGVYARRLSDGREAAVRADELFPTASTVKVPILAALLARVDSGALDYNAPLVYESTRAYVDDDLSANLKDGAKLTPAKLAWLMETLSDNTAALWCQELAGGGAAVNEWLAAHGLEKTRVNSRTPGREAERAQYGWGQTTPREMAGLFALMAQRKAGSPAASDELLRALSRSFWDGEALSVIPPRVHAASKQGAVDHSRSEVLLVSGPAGDYVLAVYTKDQTDASWRRENEGYELLRRVSAVVWRAFGEAKGWEPAADSLRFYHKD